MAWHVTQFVCQLTDKDKNPELLKHLPCLTPVITIPSPSQPPATHSVKARAASLFACLPPNHLNAV